MLTTLNPRFAGAVVLLSLVGLYLELIQNNYSIVAFFLGVLATLPLMSKVWRTMEKNWPVYRVFYSMPFNRRNMKLVRKSWNLTWWIIPYVVIVFALIDSFVLLNPGLGNPYCILYGALVVVFGYTLLYGQKFYEDAMRSRKK
jgi:hypothetical protein